MRFSRTYARFIFYYKPKENLFSQICTIGKSPLSRFSYAPAAISKGGGGLYIPLVSHILLISKFFLFLLFLYSICYKTAV